jgi:putative tryptophan/tyrosine transport system substrate-binding protein
MTASKGALVMPSRRAVVIAGAATLVRHSAGSAQQPGRTYRIGFISLSPRSEPALTSFFDELRQLGFVEGSNLRVEGKFEVDPGKLDAAADAVVKQAPAAIVCPGTAVVRAAQDATRTIPILAVAYDPVGSKLVASRARPDSNATGISIVATELDSKRQEILMEFLPGVRHIAALADPNASQAIPAMRETAAARDIQLSIYWVATPDEIGPAIEAAQNAEAKALNVLASPMFFQNRKVIFSAVARARMPAIYQWPEMAVEGGLIAYGPSLRSIYRSLAKQLVKMLKGSKPANIPVEQPTSVSLSVNLKNATVASRPC